MFDCFLINFPGTISKIIAGLGVTIIDCIISEDLIVELHCKYPDYLENAL